MRTLTSRLSRLLGRQPQPGPAANRRRAGRKHRPAHGALRLEALEDRAMMDGVQISISDTTLNEVSNLSAFTTPNVALLDHSADLAFGPSRNADTIPDLYVVGRNSDNVVVYDGATGVFVEEFAGTGLDGAAFLAFGPDGDLFTSTFTATGERDTILRVDQATKAVTTFVPNTANGGLLGAKGMAFGADGDFYVASAKTDQILRYDGASGAFLDAFVAAGSGGLDGPGNILFGPDRNGDTVNDLFVSSNLTDEVLVYSGVDGSPLGAFVGAGSGGLDAPHDMEFGPDGNLYVVHSTAANEQVFRFDGTTGAIMDIIVPPVGIAPETSFIAFDDRGDLYISSENTSDVLRYSAGPLATLSAPSVGVVTVDFSTADGSAVAGSDYTAQSGTITFQPGETSRRILLAAKDDTDVEASEAFSVQLSNPTGGATIADSSATVNIVDEDAGRSVTIADTSANEGDHAAHYRGAFVDGYPNAHFSPVVFGPDGNLYTAVGTGAGYNTIRRYEGTTGAFIDTFVPVGAINGVRDIVFRDGYLYVGSEYTDEVLRYNAATGAFVDAFVSAGSGGIGGPHGLAFGPDANGDTIPELYVSGRDSFSVVRYDGVTGLPLGTYVTSGSGGLSWPEAIAFDSSGTYLYVASTGSSQILKYNAQTGAYVGVGASTGLSGPKDVKFGPDGLMYVTSGANDRIVRFTASGAYVDDYVPAASGGMDNPSRLAFGPDGNLYVTATGKSEIMRFGTESEAVFTVSLSTSSISPLSVDFSTANGSALAGSDYTAAVGTITFAPGITSRTIRVPTLDDAIAESRETFSVNLSNAVGAVIADGQGVATIRDSDSTKFYVVDDASTNRTYEYADATNSIENYTLNSGNTAPRGAASTTAGDKVWVVDANRKVYVYNTSGSPLGSWTAGTLQSTAQVEGIAVSGNDVWIVDNKTDKVYKYAGAATRLTGSANATSSFNLNNGNTSPKDIVAGGANLWVVNDSTTDKVFKYTLTGSLVGSWTIDAANASPTGITLDPANVGDLWIVDNAADKVFEYRGAATRTSGSQPADATFALALAAGNTNPQGIADPPLAAATRPRGDHGNEARPTASYAPSLDTTDQQAKRRRAHDLAFAAQQSFAPTPWAGDWLSDQDPAETPIKRKTRATTRRA